jgi:carbamoylphosphate synthase large subunit
LECVLKIAIKESVDAVVAYGTDVGATTAAWVAEHCGLRGNPYDAVVTLTNKGRFRQFQRRCGFYTPEFIILTNDDLSNRVSIETLIRSKVGIPLIVKPVDASGSRGVTRVYESKDLEAAITKASMFSRCGDIIVEELVPGIGFQICGEGFIQDGKIIFHAFADEHFSPGIVPPIAESFPCEAGKDEIACGVAVLQAIFTELGMKDGPFNFDLLYTARGDILVIEIGPRNGGNRMPEAIIHAFGVDMIKATVESALGRKVELLTQHSRCCSTYSIHAKESGVFLGVDYSREIIEHIVSEQIFVVPGERVERFEQGSQMLGCLILAYENHAQMKSLIGRLDDLVCVHIVPREASG